MTAASGVAGGAMGLLIALWRDRTFQSISLTILMVVFSVAGVEAVRGRLPDARVPGRAAGQGGAQPLPGDARGALSPVGPDHRRGAGVEPRLHRRPADVRGRSRRLRHVHAAELEPRPERAPRAGARRPRPRSSRRWSRSRRRPLEAPGRRRRRGVDRGRLGPIRRSAGARPIRRRARRVGQRRRRRSTRRPARRPACTSPGGPTGGSRPRARPYRQPWTNPILWRELMTRAYGTKPLIIKGCYVLLFALGVGLFFHSLAPGPGEPAGTRPGA